MANDDEMQGRICLITGATDGIGKVTARVLAEKGAHVIVHGRNREKAERTVRQIKDASGNEAVTSMLADFAAQDEVRALAATFKERYDHLHVLVNNAGAFFWSRQETEDGIERTLAVNHLAPFLLTNLLLEALRAGGTPARKARIVTVSSDAHRGRRLDFDDLQNRHGYSSGDAYGQSKLANLYFTYELARRLEGSDVTANAVHPGFVATNIGANNVPVLGGVVKAVINLFARGVEKGAETSVYLAASPEVEGVSGKYFVDCEPAQPSPAAYDKEAARRLWQMSAEMVGL